MKQLVPKKTAVLFASRPILAGMRRYVAPGALVVGVDAGWQNARQLGLAVDLAVGDFDSAPPPKQVGEVLCLPPEKDDTDTHFAARELLRRGYGNFVLLGALGGRKDHEMANLQTMLFLAQQGARVLAAAEDVEIRCMGPGELRLLRGRAAAGETGEGAAQPEYPDSALPATAASPWRWLSVFAAGGPVQGVCLEGVKYPLQNYTMLPEFPIGVSNEFAAEEAIIRCSKGYLYVMVSANEPT